MNIYKHLLKVIILLIGVLPLAAQQPMPIGSAVVYPSIKGNLITVMPGTQSTTAFAEILRNTSSFKISRSELLLTNRWTSFKKIGQTKRSKTLAELRNIVTQDGIDIIKFVKKAKTDQVVQEFLNNEYRIDTLKTLGFYNSKFFEALGLGFNDTETSQGTIYAYRITRIDKSGKEELWAEPKVVSNVPNPLLNHIKITQDTILSGDSLVMFKFHLDFPTTGVTKTDTLPQYAPINTRLSGDQQRELVKNQNDAFVRFLNASPIDPERIKYNIYYQQNGKGWKFLKKPMTFADSVGMYRLSAVVNSYPDDLIEVRIVPEDFDGATSHPDSSRTFAAYSISQAHVPLIYAVSGKDSTDCIIINWELDTKPYHTGVMIERRQGEGPLELLDIGRPDLKTFKDTNVEPGGIYTYYVKALFNPKQAVAQKAASTVVLSSNTFSLPFPPTNLRIDTASKEFPILKWDATKTKSTYAFIVFRGPKPNQLSHLGNVVKENTFTDSTGLMTSREKMYYAVVTQNLTQDTSDFSNIVEFRPQIALDIEAPQLLNAKLINGEVFFDWPEMRKKDSFISGYRLQRRSELDTLFKTVGPNIITNTFFTDTTFKRGYFHEYRLAAVADDGQVGPYSMAFEVDFPMPRPSGVSAFSLRNTTKGVLVKWPSVELATTKSYVIYRNDPPKAQLRKLATIPAGSFEYVDTTVSDTGSYLYAMSIVAKDGRESQRSPRKSLKRAKPNKLPTAP